jgi:thiol-disulfide isomerase/thioredoxin
MIKQVRIHIQILFLFCISPIFTLAQSSQNYSLFNIGDKAPPLRVKQWIKGNRIDTFEKGTTYVVDLWATWCAPCLRSMPELSALARKYKNKVTFIGVNCYENVVNKQPSTEKIKKVVDSLGKHMNFNIAIEDSNFIETDWLIATGAKNEGIPRSFIINAEGKLAWIGHPHYLDSILKKIINDNWNTKNAFDLRNNNKEFAEQDILYTNELMNYYKDEYLVDENKPYKNENPDSVLFAINKIVINEPKFKYAPYIVGHTFRALLQTDMNKAYEYGKLVLLTSTYEDPAYSGIIWNINFFSDKLKLSPNIYELGANALQVEIDGIFYPKYVNISKKYHKMAAWYWLANAKKKAISAERKAIKVLRRQKNFSKLDLIMLKLQLKKYKRETPSFLCIRW